MEILFRTETAYGNSGHTPAEILAYETFSEELSNGWIPEELRYRISRYTNNLGECHPIVDKLKEMSAMIESGEADKYFEDYTLAIPFYQEVLDAMAEIFGKRIECLLWLTEIDTVLDENMYGGNIENPIEDIDAYDVGEALCMLICVMCDGNLYAFSKTPKPLDKIFVEEALKIKQQKHN